MRAILAGLALGALCASATAADINAGASLYAIHCAACHGANGVAVMPNAPNFTRAEGLLQPDMMLLMSIKGGRAAMPGYAGVLRDREILDVIAYLRTLQQ